jgi:hypothetical protein
MLISSEMTSIGGQASRATIDPQARTNNLNGLEADNQRNAPANSEANPEQAAPRLSRDEGSVLTVSDEARALADSASESADTANQASQQLTAGTQANEAVAQPSSRQQALEAFSQVEGFGGEETGGSFSAFA